METVKKRYATFPFPANLSRTGLMVCFWPLLRKPCLKFNHCFVGGEEGEERGVEREKDEAGKGVRRGAEKWDESIAENGEDKTRSREARLKDERT